MTHLANEVLAMHVAEPGIGVQQAWDRWQSRQGGKSDTRRAIPARERLIGPLLIVMLHKRLVGFPYLLKGVGTGHQQTFLLERAMIALDKSVEIGSVWRADGGLDPQAQQEPHKGGREIASTGNADPTCIPIKGDRGRDTMLLQDLSHGFQSRLRWKSSCTWAGTTKEVSMSTTCCCLPV